MACISKLNVILRKLSSSTIFCLEFFFWIKVKTSNYTSV